MLSTQNTDTCIMGTSVLRHSADVYFKEFTNEKALSEQGNVKFKKNLLEPYASHPPFPSRQEVKIIKPASC